MSFSFDVKNELCRTEIGKRPQAMAECYGALLFCNRFDREEIRFLTGSEAFAGRLPKLFLRAFGVSFDEVSRVSAGGKRTVLMRRPESIRAVADALGYGPGVISHHVNLGLLEDDESRAGFLRGAFLAGGSVTDPVKRYHLELVTGHYTVSRQITALFIDMGFEPKSVARAGNYIIYFKQSALIEDILTTAGAPVAAMRVMSAKIEKDMTNLVNRKVNCDTANVAKSVEASAQVLVDIKKLRDSGVLTSLSDKLREAARLREENPELTLSELADLTGLTKSGLNHRLRKLSEIARALN